MLLVLSDAFTDGRVLQPAVMHYSMDGGEKFLKRRMQSVFNRVTFWCICSAAHWSDLSRSHQRATLNASDVMRKNYTFCLRSILFSLWMATRCVLKALDVTLKNLTLRKKKKKKKKQERDLSRWGDAAVGNNGKGRRAPAAACLPSDLLGRVNRLRSALQRSKVRDSRLCEDTAGTQHQARLIQLSVFVQVATRPSQKEKK